MKHWPWPYSCEQADPNITDFAALMPAMLPDIQLIGIIGLNTQSPRFGAVHKWVRGKPKFPF